MMNDRDCVNFAPGANCRRGALPIVAAVGLLLMSAGPAAAHIEVFTDAPVQAGTGPVTLHFMAESESPTVGIVSVKTQLPQGVAPEDVALASAPEGWAMTMFAEGFEPGGPAVAPGVDAKYSVTVAQLPANTMELAFPTLQRYSDGREDAWIQPVTDALPDPRKPAPVLSVAPAPPGATTAATPSPTASGTAAAAPTASTDARTDEAADAAEDGSNTGTVVLVVVPVVVAIAAGAWVWRVLGRALANGADYYRPSRPARARRRWSVVARRSRPVVDRSILGCGRHDELDGCGHA